MNKEIKWPMKLEDAISVMFSHNEIIALWYESKNDNLEDKLIYRGEAWATPDEYLNFKMEKFLGVMPEHWEDSSTINILVSVDESTLVVNLPKKRNSNENCTEEEISHATISQ